MVYALVAFALVQTLNIFRKQFMQAPARQLLFAPPAEIKKFSLGYNEVIADSFWLRVLQDSDLCEQNFSPQGGPRVGVNRTPNCKEGWVYHMLAVVLECAPRWQLPARVGPMLLSIVVDDRDGATLLFKKSVENFPNDWVVLFRAGYHFLYELDDKLMAAQFYNRAALNGAPLWARSLAAKLYSETGRHMVARAVLVDALTTAPEGAVRDKLLKRLQDVDEQIAKAEK